jgi:predicted TPR repeat methyltransferase
MVVPTKNPERGPDFYGRNPEINLDLRYPELYGRVIDLINSDKSINGVLEVGCGYGFLSKRIFAVVASYRGFDFSQQCIEGARKRESGALFEVKNLYDPYSFYPVDYDCIVCIEVLEHVEDLKALLNFPSGKKFIISVPDFASAGHLRMYKDPEKDIKSRFKRLLKVEGLEVIYTARKNRLFLFWGITL